jgi:hypothetical protein
MNETNNGKGQPIRELLFAMGKSKRITIGRLNITQPVISPGAQSFSDPKLNLSVTRRDLRFRIAALRRFGLISSAGYVERRNDWQRQFHCHVARAPRGKETSPLMSSPMVATLLLRSAPVFLKGLSFTDVVDLGQIVFLDFKSFRTEKLCYPNHGCQIGTAIGANPIGWWLPFIVVVKVREPSFEFSQA